MKTITVLAYKSESSDYCMGCLMERYGSDFEFGVFPSEDFGAPNPSFEEDAVKFIAKYEGYETKGGEDGYDVTVLIDGVQYNDWCFEDGDLGRIEVWVADKTGNNLYTAKLVRSARLLAQQVQQKKREDEEARKRKEEATKETAKEAKDKEKRLLKERRDAEDYVRLKRKFEGVEVKHEPIIVMAEGEDQAGMERQTTDTGAGRLPVPVTRG